MILYSEESSIRPFTESSNQKSRHTKKCYVTMILEGAYKTTYKSSNRDRGIVHDCLIFQRNHFLMIGVYREVEIYNQN